MHTFHQGFTLCEMKSLINAEDTLFALHFEFIFIQAHVYSKSLSQCPFSTF